MSSKSGEELIKQTDPEKLEAARKAAREYVSGFGWKGILEDVKETWGLSEDEGENNSIVDVICEDIRVEIREMNEVKTSRKDLLDCVHNLMALVDSPVGRSKNTGDFADEARAIGRKIMEDNGRGDYNKNG